MTLETDGKCRVLLVEDETLIAMLMEEMLAEFACEGNGDRGTAR